MKFLQIITISMFLLAILSTSCNKPAPKTSFDVSGMDLSVSPSDDFDNYVNGGWKAANPLPADKSRYGTFDKLRDEAEKQLQTLFEEITTTQHQQGSIGQKIADFYNTGMDSAAIDALGAEPLKPYLEAIAKIENTAQIQEAIAKAHASGRGMLFSFFGSADRQNSDWVITHLYQGGLGLSDRDYYLSDDTRSKEIREEYVKHLNRMFALAGFDAEIANQNAQKVMSIETALAQASMTRIERRDPHKTYNKMTLADLESLTPGMDWQSFFTINNLSDPGDINIGMPDFFVAVDKLMQQVPIEDWKAYLTWNAINSAAPYLSSDFVEQDFQFYGKFMQGQEENRVRWKRIQETVNGALSEAIGQMYVESYFPPKAKERMLNLVENLRVSLGQRIDSLEWMSDDTKVKAHEKLAAINVKIGYPDKWRDYSGMEIANESFLANIFAAREFNSAYNRAKINKPVDKTEWFMSPQTVNAYYSPTMNEIAFPAAILQPPFFYLDADDALNYGAIGVVIGHEITHGFDDQGRKYDATGNLNNWWTDEDGQRFEERTQKLVDQYSGFQILDSLYANGQLTLGENIADLGGLNISYQAFQNAGVKTEPIDGFTSDQRFFLAYARIWANNIRDREMERLTKEGVHSLGRWRVMGPLRNMPQFHQAFDIEPESFMHLSQDQRAVIW